MKPGRPVLYELLKEQPRYRGSAVQSNGHPEPQPRGPAAPPVPEPSPLRNERVLSAGRSVRLPIGYFFVAAAALIILAAGAYVFGYLSGKGESEPSDLSAYRAESESRRLAEELRDPVREGANPRAPIGQTGGSRDAGTASPGSPSGQGTTGGGGGGPLRAGPAPGSAGEAVPILSDPRESGFRYFRLTYTTRANAVELAGFCRENGLEAYAVSANNGDLFFVYVLPGFAEGDTRTEKALTERIEEVRALWKAKTTRDDLRGYVPYLKR